MLTRDSSLRRLPPDLDREQILFFDGIRHAYEIAELSLSRLRTTLTKIALNASEGPADPIVYTHAFLDAWAYIDAIDRFRALWTRCPGFTQDHDRAIDSSLHTLTQPVRDLRNVADHIAQRAQFIVSKGGSALGTLTWITILEPTALKGRSCVLKPGSFVDKVFTLPELLGRDLYTDEPTGFVSLGAGGYSANLIEIFPHIELRVRHLESEVGRMIEEDGSSAVPGAADALLIADFSGKPDDPPSAP